MRALVLGSGVIGLTTAVRLLEAGWQVTIRAARPWSETVSNTAAAIWYPYHAYPAERIAAWSARSLEVFAALEADPEAGVRMLAGRILWSDPDHPPALDQIPTPPSPIAESELPPGSRFGVVARIPCIDMPRFLPWLERRFLDRGGSLETGEVASLAGALAAAPLVVNCTGLGARELAGDPAVEPIRGQIVRVENPGLDRFVLDVEGESEEVTYVIPRTGEVILGATAQPGRWDTEPDPEVARGILERCLALEPALRGARVLGGGVGLRPGRPSVRVEAEPHPGAGHVIHNYGHGGAGVTVAWGCAEEVVAIAERIQEETQG